MAQAENLRTLHQNPTFLIPERLLQVVHNPEIIRIASFETILGSQSICQDNEYLADLSFIIFEESGLKNPGDPGTDEWDMVLERQRLRAIQANCMTDMDRPLLYFSACEFNPQGAEIAGYIEASSLRRKGIGLNFYQILDRKLQQMGYLFAWGNHNKTNIGFFCKLDRYTIDQLQPGSLSSHDIFMTPGGLNSIPAIRFLDQGLERACVKPEFLRH